MDNRLERRQYERYRVNENVFTCCRLRSPKVAEVVDISEGGLAFSYVGKMGPSKELLELDIVFPDGTWLESSSVGFMMSSITWSITSM